MNNIHIRNKGYVEGFHHGIWCVGADYNKLNFFSYGEKEYIIIRNHIAEPEHEPKPDNYAFYDKYYKVYRGDRTLGDWYAEEEVFKHEEDYYLVKQSHKATADNAPSKKEESPSFRKLG